MTDPTRPFGGPAPPPESIGAWAPHAQSRHQDAAPGRGDPASGRVLEAGLAAAPVDDGGALAAVLGSARQASVSALREAAALTARCIFAVQLRTVQVLLDARQALEPGHAAPADAFALQRAVLDGSPDGIVVYDPLMHVSAYNSRFRAMWGIPDELMAGGNAHPVIEFVARQIVDRARYLDHIRRMLSNPTQECHGVFEAVDGRWLERHALPQRLMGRCVGVVCTWRDVTLRQRAEADLRHSQRRLKALHDNIFDAVLLVDDAGAAVEVNTAACQLLGASRERILQRGVAPWVVPSAGAATLSEHGRRLSAHGRHSGVLMLRRGGGRRISVEFNAVANVLPGLHLVVLKDVTERLRGEEMQRAKEAAEAASRGKSVFLSRMSHELRSPLQAMLGATELLAQDPAHALTPTQLRYLGHVQAAGGHLLALMDELLDVTRIESGAVPIRLQSVDPLEVAARAFQNARRLPGAAVLELVFDDRTGSAPTACRADPTRLLQVLDNLMSNAVKYSRPGGRVTLWVGAAAGQVELGVEDRGLGMTAEQRAHLFEPFNRLGREHSGIAGTGMGLVVTRQLVGLMNGGLFVDSQVDAGSVFRVVLPHDQGAARRVSPPLVSAPAPTEEGSAP